MLATADAPPLEQTRPQPARSEPTPAEHPTPARRRYPSDLTDAQWDRVCRLLDADGPAEPPGRGRPRTVSVREVLNAINYRWRTGCTWRMLPHDFPAWATVYAYYRQWRGAGALAELRAVLMERETVLEKIAREHAAREHAA